MICLSFKTYTLCIHPTLIAFQLLCSCHHVWIPGLVARKISTRCKSFRDLRASLILLISLPLGRWRVMCVRPGVCLSLVLGLFTICRLSSLNSAFLDRHYSPIIQRLRRYSQSLICSPLMRKLVTTMLRIASVYC